MNLVVCDFDGVLTRLYDENGEKDSSSYLNYDSSSYAPSCKLVDRLKLICKMANAKVLISSNWRRFGDNDAWPFNGQQYVNQLPKLKCMLGDLVYGELPKDRHITKSEALQRWLKSNEFNGKYVIFDDDLSEGFQNIDAFAKRFIHTDYKYGITVEDYEKAIEILTK